MSALPSGPALSSHSLSMVSPTLAMSASLQARLEKEADEQAWAEVRRLLAARSRAMEEIDALCSKIGELYEAVIENGQTAQNAAPVKINLGSAFELQGRMPSQIGVAIMSRVHLSVGRPFSVQAVNIDQFCTAYDNQIRFNGLPGFLGPVHNATLLHSQ